jgi:LPXTG-motif cell wall-anchored protein
MASSSVGALLLVVLVSPAQGVTTAATGAVVKVAAPASVAGNAFESDTEIRVFDEKQGAILTAPLAVDITTTGSYGEVSDLTAGTIAAGTRVDSHLLHADPAGDPEPTAPVAYEGSVTFDGDILGVIVRNTQAEPNLNDSDILGAAATLYPTDLGTRGLEFFDHAGGDLVVAGDLRTLSIELVTHRYDQIRVITRAAEPPTTTTMAPSTTTTTAPPTTTTTAPATTVAGAVETAPAVLQTLPRTGAEPRPLLALGVLAVALGGLALGFGRRRPTSPETS